MDSRIFASAKSVTVGFNVSPWQAAYWPSPTFDGGHFDLTCSNCFYAVVSTTNNYHDFKIIFIGDENIQFTNGNDASKSGFNVQYNEHNLINYSNMASGYSNYENPQKIVNNAQEVSTFYKAITVHVNPSGGSVDVYNVNIDGDYIRHTSADIDPPSHITFEPQFILDLSNVNIQSAFGFGEVASTSYFLSQGGKNYDLKNDPAVRKVDPEGIDIVHFVLGSNGQIGGSQNFTTSWELAQDSGKLDLVHTSIKLFASTSQQFLPDSRALIGEAIYSAGSISWTYTQLANALPLGIIDKILQKLPIKSAPDSYLGINIYEAGELIASTLVAKIDYYGQNSITVSEIEDAEGNIFKFYSTDEDSKKDSDDYEDDEEEEDGDDDDFTGGTDSMNGSALLTTSYSLTASNIKSFGNWLWTGLNLDDLQLVNNNPIENVVSAKLFPFSVSGTNSTVTLGNVNSGIDADKLDETVARTFTFGQISIPKLWSDKNNLAFLDYAPFTRLELHLPYLGIHEIDPTLVMDKTISLTYYVDLVTGSCRAVVKDVNAKKVIISYDGQIGQDIPITASNRAQVEVGYITGGLHTVANLLSGNVLGAVDSAINTATAQYHTTSSGTPSPSNSRFDHQGAYLIINRPQLTMPSSFNHQKGRMCNLSMKLSECTGYTELDGSIDLSGLGTAEGMSCTDAERTEILELLTGGIYL